MEKEGSTVGFVFSLIGGIFGIFGAITLVFNILLFVWASGFIGQSVGPSLVLLGFLALYFAVLSLWIIYAGIWMRKNISLRKGALTSLILGILSLNILAIIGGIVGLAGSKKINTPNI